MTRLMVSGMLEEAPGVCGSNRRQRSTYRFYLSFFAPGSDLAQQLLDLGERLFYGVVVGGVSRQIEQLAALPLDEFPDPLWSVCSEALSITTICPARRFV